MQENLTSLESAYFSGTTRVKYADREVNYRSLGEIKTLIDQLKAQLGIRKKRKHIPVASDNGLS